MRYTLCEKPYVLISFPRIHQEECLKNANERYEAGYMIFYNFVALESYKPCKCHKIRFNNYLKLLITVSDNKFTYIANNNSQDHRISC